MLRSHSIYIIVSSCVVSAVYQVFLCGALHSGFACVSVDCCSTRLLTPSPRPSPYHMLVCADGDVAGWSPRCRRIALVIISSVARYLAPRDMKTVYQQVGAGAHDRGLRDEPMSLDAFCHA